MDDQRARGLRHGLDDQDARHHRVIGEMALEMRLVVADRLVARGAFVDTISVSFSTNRNGAAMRQQALDVLDAEHQVRWMLFSHGRSVSVS